MDQRKASRREQLERAMLSRGYVSVRMAARKTALHPSTLARRAADGSISSTMSGRQLFIEIGSLVKFVGADVANVFQLSDWSPEQFFA